MDIREVSKEEKKEYIKKVNMTFDDIRVLLKTLSSDMESDDLMIQASAVWIGGNLCTWFSDFMMQIKALDKTQKSLNDIKTELKDIVNDNPQSNH